MDEKEFHDYFGLDPSIWSHRLYEIFNQDFNDCVPFKDFLHTVWQVLVFDRENTEKLAFQLLSRRGATFQIESTCLDLQVRALSHFSRVVLCFLVVLLGSLVSSRRASTSRRAHGITLSRRE
jgi:hypothetical protein